MSGTTRTLHDKYACAELIQAWGLYRDQGKWPQLLATFVPDGQIAVSWFSGSFREFVDRCRAELRGGSALQAPHLSLARARRRRARAGRDQHRDPGAPEDRRRARRHDVLCALPRPAGDDRDGRWAIVERAAIYERDRLDPVEPSEAFDRLFTASDLSVYPEPYRYMAARLVAAGRALAPVVYSDGSPHTAQLYARYEAWLRGT